MRRPSELSDEWLGAKSVAAFLKFRIASLLDVSSAETGSRSDVVNVLLDVAWDMIFFGRNIMLPRDVLPDVELGEKQSFGLGGCCIKLNPLRSVLAFIVSRRLSRHLVRKAGLSYLPVCW